MTSLHVICGLPPPIKNPGYTMTSVAKDQLFEDRPCLGQEQEWSRPTTSKDKIFLNYGWQTLHNF